MHEELVEALTRARKEWPSSTCPPEDYDRFVAEQIEPIIRDRLSQAWNEGACAAGGFPLMPPTRPRNPYRTENKP